MRRIEHAMQRITRSIQMVEDDYFTPAQTTPEITDHLIDLANTDPATQERFTAFLNDLPAESLYREMLIQVIPDEIVEKINDLRARHEDLQFVKETHIENQEFDEAAAKRDEQENLYKELRQLLHNNQLYITPATIDTSLQSLGWIPES